MPKNTIELPGKRASTQVSTIIKAPRKAVYQACLDPDALALWRVPNHMNGQVGMRKVQDDAIASLIRVLNM
jgi:uncharacterized protein YndB with AHSA1/START domain